MNKYISLLFDYMALVQLHTRKSKSPQFYMGLTEYPSVSDLYSFYAEPEIPDIKFNGSRTSNGYNKGIYSYYSRVKTQYDCNNISSGLFYENILPEDHVHVIIVHGWRLEKMDWIESLLERRLLNEKYNIYYFTLPYHFERKPDSSLYSGEYMVSANIDRTLEAIKQAVSDIRALIKWLKSNRNGKIVLIGISLGGMVSNLVGVLENRVDCLVSVFGAACMAYSVWNSVPGLYAKREFRKNNITFEQTKRFWEITNPSCFKPAVPVDNILLAWGLYDRFVLMEDSINLWESWDKPKRILYPCGHAGVVLDREIIGKDLVSFIKERAG